MNRRYRGKNTEKYPARDFNFPEVRWFSACDRYRHGSETRERVNYKMNSVALLIGKLTKSFIIVTVEFRRGVILYNLIKSPDAHAETNKIHYRLSGFSAKLIHPLKVGGVIQKYSTHRGESGNRDLFGHSPNMKARRRSLQVGSNSATVCRVIPR